MIYLLTLSTNTNIGYIEQSTQKYIFGKIDNLSVDI